MVVGSALDIVEHCGVPRYLHNDIPLGNPLGRPYQPEEQLSSVRQALRLIEEAKSPVIHINKGVTWTDGEVWRENYSRVDDSNRELLKQKGVENRRLRRERIANGEKRERTSSRS